RKRILSLLLAALTVVGMFPTPTFAADSLEEAMAEINIYARDRKLNWLTMNGSVKEQEYTYYNYRSAQTNETKEIPAYCVDPRLYGVPAKTSEGTPIKYSAESTVNDPKICGIISNGYPHMTLNDLGLQSVDEAYYATKTALWIYLLGNWSISGLGVNPNLTGADKEAAQRVLTATKTIYERGMYWNEMVSPKLTATADTPKATRVTINGRDCYQQVFTIDSNTWALQPVRVSLAEGAPAGAVVMNMDNDEISQIILSTERTSGAGFQGKVKVVYPAESIEGETGTCQLKLSATVVEYRIYYAKTLEADKYGNLQHYMLDTDPSTPMLTTAISSYSSDPDTPDTPDTPDEPEASTLKIVKREEGTEKPLAGAVFRVLYPNGNEYGSFSTDSSGTITLPVKVFGNYTVTELVPPAYHTLPTHTTQHVTVTAATGGVLTFWNAPYGNLRIHKISDTGDNLAGATVQIRNLETGETRGGKTGAGGVIEFTELKPGGYEVRETAGVEGYILDTEATQTATVVAGETSEVTFINKEKPGLRIVKYDRATLQTMPDVTFEIWRDGASLGRYTTDQLGEILLTGQQPGTFVAREVQAPDSHVTDATPQQIELKAGDGIRQLVFFNSEKPKLRLIKVDSENLSKVIPNAKFSIQKVEGDAAAQEYTTDVNGEIDLSKLAPGSYAVTELDCPGYVIDDARRIIELRGDETGEYVFTNSKRPTIHIIKLSSDGTPLPGVAFRIARIEDGTRYLDRTTDATGEITIDNLDPGVYSVRETSTVADHVLDTREFHVEMFPGKTSTLVVENQRRPNLTVYKHDADTGEAIADTVFEVRAADGHSVDEIKTDESGKAELYNLLPGVYEITEKSVPADWLLDAPSQLVTLYPARDHTVYFENHRKPTLTVNKVSSVTGKPLEGAKFNVTYASNNTDTGEINDLGTFYTDENGQFKLTGLRDGWYKVEELASVPGYQPPNGNAVQTLYVGGGSNAVMTFENVPLSAITVYKYDTVTGEAVRDAVFEVRYLTDTSGTGGTAIGRYKTGANGSFTVTGLVRGTYIVEELASDNGHVIDSAPQTCFLSGEDQDVVQLYFGNTPKGSVLIVKKDALTGKPLPGVEFTVTDSSGAVLGNANGKYTTDASGSVLIDGLDPGVTVVAKESRAISGYILDDTPQTAQVKAGATVTLEFRNQPKGGLIVEKYDSVTKEPLSGATFRITDANGELLPDNEGLTSSNGLYTTNAEGQIVLSKVSPATLVVSEVTAPDGYRLDPKPQTVVVNAGDTQTLRFYDDPLCTLTILKRDADTKAPLKGAEFTVKYTDGTYAGSNNGRYVTGADGTVTVTGLKPESTVIVSEDKAPTGYLKDDSPKTVVVHTGAANMLAFEDEAATTLIIRKFIEGTANEPLSGVAFKVIDGAGAAVGSDDGVYYTDHAGEIVLTGLEPGTTVKVREIKTVDGFVLDGTPQDILIKAGEVQQLTFWNARCGALVIRKLSGADQSPIPGAEFELRYADGRFVDQAGGKLSSNGRYTTDDKGEIRISDVTGTIVATEVKPAAGFTMNAATASQTVVVRSGETQTLTFFNDPYQTVVIQKYIEGTTKPLAGVTFLLTDGNGNRIGNGEYVTDENGRITLLAPVGSTIVARETKTVKGYVLDATPKTITVTGSSSAQVVSFGSSAASSGATVIGSGDGGNQITFYDEATGALTLIKRDSVTKQPLQGARFLITYANGEYVADNGGETSSNGMYTTDDKGMIVIRYLQPCTLVIREVEQPQGYLLNDTPVTVEIGANDHQTVEVFNDPIGGLELLKVDANDKAKRLANATFEIRRMDQGVVSTITTDKNGRAAAKLDPGDYYAVEIEAPEHYRLDSTPTYFSIAEGKTTTVT
ncbi:MAG: Cys-Gln thioester bond-forming surface protein, partial [Synergistaceae bacterium]|nr:Cys-Gln thioester bond-forming surface protein [Synergistaceae bacterium]